MTVTLLRGDAATIPLADDTVDLIVTSPPYFALRSYTDGGEHYDGQLGSEATPAEFLDALWAVTAECKRVLKPSGSMFVNLGDKYAGDGRGTRPQAATGQRVDRKQAQNYVAASERRSTPGIPAKSLMGLPWRYAIGCIDRLGLILRAEMIWSKPNGLPESVRDRVRRSHEQWFMFTKEPRYFSAVDEIRESRSGDVVVLPPKHLPSCPLFVGPPDSLPTVGVEGGHEVVPSVERLDLANEEGADQRVHGEHVVGPEQEREAGLGSSVPLLVGGDTDGGADVADLGDDAGCSVVDRESEVGGLGSPVGEAHGALSVDDSSEPSQVCTCGHATYPTTGLGKLPGSVWSIPSEPLKVPDDLGVDHYAAFPQEWPRRLILGWSPPGICTACGEGRRPVVQTESERVGTTTGRPKVHDSTDTNARGFNGPGYPTTRTLTTIVGHGCACDTPDAPTRPAIILDPFVGTGTTVMVAHTLGRHGIGIDLSADYLRLADWRIHQSGHDLKTIERTHGPAAARSEATRRGHARDGQGTLDL